jgi:Ca2+-binding EF-hand superfamily protein
MSAPRIALLVLSGVLAAGAVAAQDLPATASDRFAMLDRNGDGKVSRDEYDGDAFFRLVDADHNYRVSVDEVQAVLGPQRDGEFSATEWLRIADQNGDGELSAEEMRRSSEMRFQRLDANQDGNLELSEVRVGIGQR